MVSFFISDKRRVKTSIRCSVQPKGMKRICFTVPNSTIHTKDWGVGRLKTGKGKQELSYLQQELDDLRIKVQDFYRMYYRQQGRYPDLTELNRFLNARKPATEYFEERTKIKLVDFIERVIERRVAGKELIKGRVFSSQTHSSYNSLVKSLREFEKFSRRKHMYLEELCSIQLIEQFEAFLISELNMGLNTINNRMKTLKSMLQVAVNEDLIPFNAFKKFKKVLYTEESDSVVFTKEELKALQDLDLSDNPKWDLIRDQYLLYVWSGVRKGDLENLIRVMTPGAKTYAFRTNKTGERCEIPAFETLKQIAAKYNYQFPKPVLDTTVQKEIKRICQLIPSMHQPVEKKYTKGGKEVREIKKKYEMVMIHTARRTLATLLADHGLPYHQIMKITGHKKLTTLQRYIKSDADMDEMLRVGKGILE